MSLDRLKAFQSRGSGGRAAPNFDQWLGANLKAMRLSSLADSDSVAKRLGVSTMTLLRYERGAAKVPSGELFALARIFDVPVGAFFETEGGLN